MAEVFFSRSQAIKHAQRKGWKAFRSYQPLASDRTCWTVVEMPHGPGVEFATMFAEDKDYVFAIEVTDAAIPVLIVSCFREEILDKIPEPLTLEPLTPELWANNRDSYPKPLGGLRVTKPAARRQSNDTDDALKSTGESVKGAVTICREVFAIPGITKEIFIATCIERGVIKATAQTQWSRLSKAAK